MAAADAPRRFLAGCAVLGLVLRLAFSLGYWRGQPLTRDEYEYLSLARSITAGRGYVFDSAIPSTTYLPFGRAPGYPAFLALIGAGRQVATTSPVRVKVVQSLAGAFGVVMAGLVAFRLGGRRAARAAALIAACYPPLVWIAAFTLSEAVFWPFGLALVWCLDTMAARPPSWARAVGAGMLTGAGVLLRAALSTFVPLLGIWLLVRRGIRTTLAVMIGVLLLVGPWTLRNYHAYGRLVVVASDGGVTFWTGNNGLTPGEGDMAANPQLALANEALRDRHPGLSEEAMEPFYYQDAFAWIRSHPSAWAALEFKKLFYLIVPIGPSYRVHSRLYYAASVASYGLLLPFAIVGVVRMGARRGRAPALWLLLGSAVAMCLVFFPQERFRIPIIDPALVVCAGAAWAGRERD